MSKDKKKIKWETDPTRHYMGTLYIPKGKTKPVFKHIDQHEEEIEDQNKKDKKVIKYRRRNK